MSTHTPTKIEFHAKLSGSENHRGFVIRDADHNHYLGEVIPMDEDGIGGKALVEGIVNSYNALANMNPAALAGVVEAARKCLWPNVISADDLAVLVAMSAGTGERHDNAMTAVGRLREAQSALEQSLAALTNGQPVAAQPPVNAELLEALRTIDTMPVDGCSPSVIESMLRQAKSLAYAAISRADAQGAVG